MSGESPEQTAQGYSPDAAAMVPEAKGSGLVICSIIDREIPDQFFLTQDEMDKATVGIPPRNSKAKKKADQAVYSVAFSPASIRVSKSDPRRRGTKADTWRPKQNLISWSSKSRSKMLERFATLDYSSFQLPESILGFITLTYPNSWQLVAPTASSSKTHLQSLRKRFERTYGRPLYGIWKMEFQRRGAPHFHILAPIPLGREFREWLSINWTEVVNHPDPKERGKHLLAGTGVDKAKGLSASTAHRISYYFSKHASPGIGAKEYQNTPPQEWVDAGSVGRYWGYWGLKIAVSLVEVSQENALFMARTLRRWQRAHRKVVKKTVWRVNTRTGVVYQRKVSRRQTIPKSCQSFRLVPDGAEFARLFAKHFSARGLED